MMGNLILGTLWMSTYDVGRRYGSGIIGIGNKLFYFEASLVCYGCWIHEKGMIVSISDNGRIMSQRALI